MKGADLILAKVMVFSMPFDRVRAKSSSLGSTLRISSIEHIHNHRSQDQDSKAAIDAVAGQ
jgi:hypothetical protein